MPAGRRGTNSLQLDEPLITPRTNRQPPSESGGNMYLHLSQRTSGVGAGRTPLHAWRDPRSLSSDLLRERSYSRLRLSCRLDSGVAASSNPSGVGRRHRDDALPCRHDRARSPCSSLLPRRRSGVSTKLSRGEPLSLLLGSSRLPRRADRRTERSTARGQTTYVSGGNLNRRNDRAVQLSRLKRNAPTVRAPAEPVGRFGVELVLEHE